MNLRSGRLLETRKIVDSRPRKRCRKTCYNDALNDDCLLLIFQAMEHTPTTLCTLRLVCRRWTRLVEAACVVGVKYYYNAFSYLECMVLIMSYSRWI
jgi:hypothetical protein